MRISKRAAAGVSFGLLILAVAAAAQTATKKPEYRFWPMKRIARVVYSGRINENGVAAGHLYYLTTTESLVAAVDLEQGKSAWQFKSKTPFSFPPLPAGSFVLAADDGGLIRAIDGKGKAAWTLDTKEGRGGRLAFFGGRVLFYHAAGYFSIIDPKAGKFVGRIDGPGSTPIDSWLVDGDRMLAVLRTGAVAILDPGGRETGRLEAKARFQGPLAIARGMILAGLEGGFIGLYDPSKKKMRWQRKLGPALRAVSFLNDKQVCAIGANEVLYVLSRRSGDLMWWRVSPDLSVRMLLSWQKRTVSVESTSEIFGVEDRTGRPRWRYDLGVKIASEPQLWRDGMILNLYNEANNRGFVQVMGPEPAAK